MRILALSDLNWSRTANGTDLQELLDLVDHVAPELVLLAGDLVDNDKGINHARCLPHWRDLGILLDTLESKHIHCCMVRGNWDENASYDALVKPIYRYIHEISGRMISVNGLRLLGIPNVVTRRKTTMRDLIAAHTEPVDIVLTHTDGVRRMRLYELPTKLIVTGHYDNKLSVAHGKAMIAFENYPGQYAIIEIAPQETVIDYFYGRLTAVTASYRARLVNGQVEWLTPPLPAWEQYGRHIELLFDAKAQFPTLNEAQKRELLQTLLAQGVYKAHLLEYIPGATAYLR